jgi:hypothetical protein
MFGQQGDQKTTRVVRSRNQIDCPDRMKGDRMEMQKILDNILQSAQLVLEHYRSRGFKNTLIEVGLNNIIGMSESAIEMLDKNQGKETQ